MEVMWYLFIQEVILDTIRKSGNFTVAEGEFFSTINSPGGKSLALRQWEMLIGKLY